MKLQTIVFIFSVFMGGFVFGQEIGLQLYSLRHQMDEDVSSTLKKIQSWGIQNLEDGNGGTYQYTLDEYKRLLADHDLKMVSVSAAFEELEDSPETVIERAKAYGAKYAVCFWIPHNDTIFTIKETEKAIKVFNKAGKKMKSEGITLAYHPHGYEFRAYKGELLMDYMIKGAEHFDFEMDVYWFAHPGKTHWSGSEDILRNLS